MKLRLGMALACMALLAGCPDAADDMRRARGEAGEAAVMADFSTEDWVCTNYRPWREDLDLPDYLKNPTPSDQLDPRDNAEAGRERRKKEYIAAHEGTYTVCHTILEKDVANNRGTCPICTAMLRDPQYKEKRVSHQPGSQVYGDPIQLEAGQEFADKVEFRLKFQKEDYLTKADDQIASFKEWLAKRKVGPVCTGYDTSKNPAEPIIESDQEKVIAIYVERAKAKGLFTKDEANPKQLPKFGLPPLAESLIRCPHCKKPANATESRCWNCDSFYTLSQRDERSSIAEPFETLCPFCKQPVDPTLNYCSNPRCEKFHRAIDREGPCWRCGGSHVCPECLGSGKGHGPIEGGDDCYLCGGKAPGGSNGACPECDWRGFVTYEGGLPSGFRGDKRQKGDWKLKAASGMAASAPGGDAPKAPEKE